jgi:hypothetical protein
MAMLEMQIIGLLVDALVAYTGANTRRVLFGVCGRLDDNCDRSDLTGAGTGLGVSCPAGFSCDSSTVWRLQACVVDALAASSLDGEVSDWSYRSGTYTGGFGRWGSWHR